MKKSVEWSERDKKSSSKKNKKMKIMCDMFVTPSSRSSPNGSLVSLSFSIRSVCFFYYYFKYTTYEDDDEQTTEKKR